MNRRLYTLPLTGGLIFVCLGVATADSNALVSREVSYRVFQTTSTWPRLLKVTLNPDQPNPGETQVVSVVLQSTVPIKLVQLTFEGNQKKTTAVLTKQATTAELVYSGSWVLEDAYDKKFRLQISSEDLSRRKNVLVLTKSTICQIPKTGDWIVQEACVLKQDDAIDAGSLRVRTGGMLTLLAKLGRPSDKPVFLESGAILMADNGKIVKGTAWIPDVDGDRYMPEAASLVLQEDRPNGFSRRADILGVDCNDQNPKENKRCKKTPLN